MLSLDILLSRAGFEGASVQRAPGDTPHALSKRSIRTILFATGMSSAPSSAASSLRRDQGQFRYVHGLQVARTLQHRSLDAGSPIAIGGADKRAGKRKVRPELESDCCSQAAVLLLLPHRSTQTQQADLLSATHLVTDYLQWPDAAGDGPPTIHALCLPSSLANRHQIACFESCCCSCHPNSTLRER